ncbi:MAG: MlaD family protein [Bacteroidota bacterium]
MKISREIKAGIIAILSVAAFIWGYNFLKGRNVLKKTRVFYAKYQNVDGLTKGRPVTINGLQIGSVSDIIFLPDMSGELLVKLEVDDSFPFSTNSLFKIYGADLMGAKSVSIDIKEGQLVASSGDTLRGVIEPGITTVLNDEVQPLKTKIENLMVSLDSTSVNIRKLTGGENGENIGKVIKNLSTNLENFVAVSNKLKENSASIDTIFQNVSEMSYDLKSFSDSLSNVELASTVKSFNDVLSSLNTTLDSVNNGNGTISKLIKDEKLYNNLTASTKELHDLLEDLKLNPKRYVHVSVFGRKNTEYEKPVTDSLYSE